jgi:hypothetical protein
MAVAARVDALLNIHPSQKTRINLKYKYWWRYRVSFLHHHLGECRMRKLRIGAIALATVLSAPAGTNGTLLVGNSEGPGITEWSVSTLTGYQHTGFSFQSPNARGAVGVVLFHPSPLDVKLGNGDLWIGGLGVNLRRGRFSSFLEMSGNAGKSTHVSTPSEPFYGGMHPVDWNGNHLDWWTIDAGVGMDVTKSITLLAGVKVEDMSMELHDPVDPTGQISTFHTVFGDTYNGNVHSRLTIPWIGAKIQAKRWSGTLRFSPLAHANLEMPFDYYFVNPIPAFQYRERENYVFKNDGLWLEGNVDYDLYTSPRWRWSLWAKASWLRVTGSATATYTVTGYGIPTPPISGSYSACSTLFVRSAGTGLRVSYSF